ncbi:hypothetical protein PAL_GLEAN10008455 [Pteropus alecto]|uniref:Uncharacterized protein n=1 Tax=Pteropus alecto TaxID=9402 RepID=L5KA12_PTEAL|nr:hypothetical protein PAL_GLEAN10008455 [Pteropus alecto]
MSAAAGVDGPLTVPGVAAYGHCTLLRCFPNPGQQPYAGKTFAGFFLHKVVKALWHCAGLSRNPDSASCLLRDPGSSLEDLVYSVLTRRPVIPISQDSCCMR